MDLYTLELTNYWLPIIWVCAAGLILNMFPKKNELVNGHVRERWFWLIAIALVIPLVIWAGARTRLGDTGAYRIIFNNAPSSFWELPSYLKIHTKDQGFVVLMTTLKSLGITKARDFFMLIAALQMFCMVFAFRKYSPNYWVCIFLFVASTDYFSWMFNGMRQFIAATVIFAAFHLLVNGHFLWYCLVVLVMSRIHGSAMLMIPLAYVMQGKAMNRKIQLLIVVTVLLLPFADRFMPLLTNILAETQYNDVTNNELWANDDGTNILRVLVYSMPAIISLFGWRYIANSNDRVMNMCINGALITMVLYLVSMVTSGVYIGRLPIYTTFQGYIALPWVLEQIFDKRSRNLILLLLVLCYAVFYYYQLGIGWGLL